MSCAGKPSYELLNEQDKKIIRDTVTLTLQHYVRDVASNGLMAEFSYLDSSADFYWIPPGFNHALSYDSVKFHIEKNAQAYNYVMNTWEELEVNPMSRNYASYRGIIHSTCIDTFEKQTEYRLIETGILVKRSSGWKLLSGQTHLIQ